MTISAVLSVLLFNIIRRCAHDKHREHVYVMGRGRCIFQEPIFNIMSKS